MGRRDAMTPYGRRRHVATARPPGRHYSAGFTLLEMLVTLAIMAAVSGLLWQALAQLARVERRLADSQLFSTEHALRREWLRQALQGAMNGPQNDAFVARGGEREFRFLSTRPPWPGLLGPVPTRLELVVDGSRTELYVHPEWPAAEGAAATPLWTFAGAARFEYLDHDGNWRASWPPPLDAGVLPSPRLPRALRVAAAPGSSLLFALPAGENPMPRRRDLEP